MSRTHTIILFAVIGAAALIALVLAGLLFFVDANAFKARLEAAVSKSLGMELSVAGPVRLTLFPGLRVTLEDMRLRNRGADIVSAKQARLGIELVPLLTGEVRITKVVLSQPSITIERDREGRFNFERSSPTQPPAGLPALDWPSLEMSGATLHYADARMAQPIAATDCAVQMRDIRLPGGPQSKLMKDISFTADVACSAFSRDAAKVADLKFAADAKGGVLHLTKVTMQTLGASGSGQVKADFSGAVPRYDIEGTFPQVPVEELVKALALKQAATGRVDLSMALALQGKTEKELRQTLSGRLSLRGKNVTLGGSNLDEAFARFEASQTFSLIDAGAFFFVGPLGLVLTKGADYANLFRGAPGSSTLETLVSDWKFERGVARAQDVAMATKANRIAVQGGLDIVNERFDEVTLALVDAKGCVKVEQKVRGPFRKPEVEKPNLLVSLAGPALSLLKKGSEVLLGNECTVFYKGAVAAPA